MAKHRAASPPTKRWRKWLNSIAFYSAVIACSVVLAQFVPELVASAHNNVGIDVRPTYVIAAWDTKRPEVFAESVRTSADDTWRKIAYYSHSPVTLRPLPHVTIVDADSCATLTDCSTGIHMSSATLDTLIADYGPGAFAAWLLEIHAAIAFDDRMIRTPFTACLAGVWLGHLDYWGLDMKTIEPSFVAYFKSRPDVDRSAMETGAKTRSTDRCRQFT